MQCHISSIHKVLCLLETLETLCKVIHNGKQGRALGCSNIKRQMARKDKTEDRELVGSLSN